MRLRNVVSRIQGGIQDSAHIRRGLREVSPPVCKLHVTVQPVIELTNNFISGALLCTSTPYRW